MTRIRQRCRRSGSAGRLSGPPNRPARGPQCQPSIAPSPRSRWPPRWWASCGLSRSCLPSNRPRLRLPGHPPRASLPPAAAPCLRFPTAHRRNSSPTSSGSPTRPPCPPPEDASGITCGRRPTPRPTRPTESWPRRSRAMPRTAKRLPCGLPLLSRSVASAKRGPPPPWPSSPNPWPTPPTQPWPSGPSGSRCGPRSTRRSRVRGPTTSCRW